MTVGLAGTRFDAGVSVVELNLNLMWEIVQQTKVGDQGVAYVVNADGRVIAHPDFRLRKSLRDFSSPDELPIAIITLAKSIHCSDGENRKKPQSTLS